MKKGLPGMMSKRITAVMLSLLMMVSAVPVEALADDEPLTEVTEVSSERKTDRVSVYDSEEVFDEVSEEVSEEISEEALSDSEMHFKLTLYPGYGNPLNVIIKTGENGSYTLTGNEFSREGWVIVGWSSSSDGEVEYAYNATIDLTQRDVGLYAVWEQPGQLYLYANYDTADPAYITKTSTTESYILSGNEISREGWAIAGWSDTSDGEIKCAKNATIHLREGDVTLYAIWAKQSCTITYYKNNEQATGNSPITERVNGGNSWSLEVETYPNPFCYANHYLAGWATTANGELKYRNCERIVVLGDMDLYAVWRQSPIGDIVPGTSGDSVYIGGILWKTIGVDADGEQALLISSDNIEINNQTTMTWAEAMAGCETVYEEFSGAEQAAVCSTVKSNDPSYYVYEGADLTGTNGAGEKLFLLSASEAETYFSGSAARALDGEWWLRSPGSYMNDKATIVDASGLITPNMDVSDSYHYGFRPAFVLDQSEILLRSAAEGDKSSAPTDGSSFGSFLDGGTGAKKLTFHDSSRDWFTAGIAEASGTSIRVNYSGAKTGQKEYVSAMLLNPGGDIIGYASMATENSATGTWDLTLPSDLETVEGYMLKIFNEQKNGDDETDYASPMYEFNINFGNQTFINEAKPRAVFNATGADCGTLTNVTSGMKYSIDGGSNWTDITGTSVTIASGISVTNGIKVYKQGNGEGVLRSDVQTIELTQAEAPDATSFTTTACTTSSNNDGTITGITTDMEYKKSDASSWIEGTGEEVTGLSNGTYYIRTRASGTMLASTYVEVTVAAFGTPSQVAAPSFSPGAGTYTEVQNVTISSATEGASIYYTTNGENPTASSTPYSGAIRVSQTTTIKAIAVKSGMTDSSVSTA
ncbi:MAG: chitobiase/beta-hexosaminidase C-terminal domain-containing protein, partial [Lachnospiraceae bacterium]|nr:chitobiase/beta-hexosaminidase C-terminal domain-containing protein [Lachnospiraceae bacterium]